ncbi:amidohydrolase family protein [Singulisphaera sp. Ch08]|uniref:Amidohydrolase family protein n=1 Tax=Singulisphaera sp. Ch08 TaxID=3120278 RepID=A0AAU7CFQ1_9BACT
MLRRFVLSTLIGLALAQAKAAEEPGDRSGAVVADLLLKGGTLIDGTGSPGRRADVALRGDRIVAVGEFQVAPGVKVLDVSERVVAPGFIDLHSHSDSVILDAPKRANVNFQTQGVTTVVTGNCGGGALNVAKYLDAVDDRGAGTNVIHLIPHGAVRSSVMGKIDRAPNERELARMKRLVEQGMKDGAWGMSTGLIYLPGRYAEIPELVELSEVVAQHGGFYASHIRNEGNGLLDSIDEALTIGRQAKIPVHISHLKASGKSSWGLTVEACKRIAEARKAGQAVSADQYPYVASSTALAAMVVPHWALQGSTEDFIQIAADAVRGKKLRQEIEESLEKRNGGAAIRIARYPLKPTRVGRDLAAIAAQEGTTVVEVVLDVQRHGGAQAISFGMSEDDVRQVMKEDFVATASDGSTHVPTGKDSPHPRAYGTFPRKIRYALDDNVMTLEKAIRSCSGLPAEILRLPDRGVIRPGAFADVVVFDPKTFRDAATFDNPTRYAPGVDHLFVNGVAVIAQGEPNKKLPGRALRLTKDGPADLILKLGRIWTGDQDRPWAQALAARDGVVVAVGTADEVLAFRGPKTQVVDRPDAFATPGLVDSHGHLCDFGSSREELDLRGVASLEDVAQRVKAWMEAHPGDSWVIGQNWDQSLWPGGDFPTAKTLDLVAPDRPVWLVRVDGHAGWANSEALRRGKVNRDTEAPTDGQIIRDPNGDPTGVFIDGAMSLVSRHRPGDSKADLTRRILAGQELVFQAGLTGVHDAGVSIKMAEAYRELDQAGKLKLRVYGMASIPDRQLVEFASHPPVAAAPKARFVLRAIKLFIDGALGSRGGLLSEDYSDDPGNKGLLLIDPKLLTTATEQGLRHGWQIATHAIGDRGNSLVLDAYQQAREVVPAAQDPRLRIEHAQVVRKADVARFASLGVIASMQPSHAIDDMRWADARLGPERAQGAYAWRWFLDANVPVAFGSDFPVEVVNPFYGIYAALTRQDEKGQPASGWHPDQKMNLEETLRAFTAGSAHASFDEARLGRLKVGMRADVTVVDRDLFQVKPLELLGAKVVMTVVDGEVVYETKAP